MQIVSLRLRNIRSFRELDIGIESSRLTARPWTLFFGDNATGKTTILRCLAIGMSDETSAAGLVREMKGSMVRNSQSHGIIMVGLVDRHGVPWTLKTVLTPIPKTGDRVRQRIYRRPTKKVAEGPFQSEEPSNSGYVKPEDFPWDKLFVCGYGAGRSTDGREDYTDYRMVDAVYTLFRYDQPLQTPELTWRRYRQRVQESKPLNLSAKSRTAYADKVISTLLARVMDLPDTQRPPTLRQQGIFLPHGKRLIALSDHADGYRSITTVLLDLVAWHLHYSKAVKLRSLRGIVLIDELEQHLHPRLQRYVVTRLREQFPQVQFITTTHSALCAANAADLKPSECGLTVLAFGSQGEEVFARDIALPYGDRVDQILMSAAFGLIDTRNPKVGDRLAEFRRLFSKLHPTPYDRLQMKKIQKELQSEPVDSSQYADDHPSLELRALIEQARQLRHCKGAQ